MGHSVLIPDDSFGEGCTLFHNKIYEMTYHEGKLYIYDVDLNLIEEKEMPKEIMEGWGMTHDEEFIYVTDSTDKLFKLNDKFEIVETL